jgi:CMP/dCMP kinase
MIITIDGPAGSGKTSVARMIAQRLGIKVLQTGLLYRAAAFVLLVRRGLVPIISAHESPVIIDVQDCFDARDSVSAWDLASLEGISYGYEVGSMFPFVSIWGQRRESFLGAAWLSLPASIISQNPEIRAWSMDVQRAVAREYSLVAEGRDCGTVVFPQAEYKFFLNASLDVRVSRIMRDRTRNAEGIDVDEAKKSVQERDAHDIDRVIAPLIAASGAVCIDTSIMTRELVVDEILQFVRAHQGSRAGGQNILV